MLLVMKNCSSLYASLRVNLVLLFCPTCNRKTMHRVDDRRVGCCQEIHVTGLSQAQLKRADKKDKELQNKQSDLELI